ncbi:branched-chain amino acid ABC transporter permease [bacterium]|nr:MAG: branched-chain amino acid ABC transporter permease [bacterium]
MPVRWQAKSNVVSFVEVVITAASFGAAFALLALSINVIYSTSTVLNFAQGEFMMLGGMLGWAFYSALGLPYWLAVLLIVGCMGLVGLLEYSLVVRPLLLRRAADIAIMIATFGAAYVIRTATALGMGRVERPAKPPLGQTPVVIGHVPILPQSFVVIGLTCAVLVLAWWLYTRTTLGLALRAAAFDPDGAQLVGINVDKLNAVTFAGGGVLAGVAGLLISPLSYASPWFGITFAISGFAAAIVGGLGSWPGAVAGGIILGLANAIMLRYVSGQWGTFATFALMLLVLYVRPTGIFGERSAARFGTV